MTVLSRSATHSRVVRPLNSTERKIAVLLGAEDFESLVCELIRDKEGGLATRYVEARSAAYLCGSTKSETHTYSPRADYGYRRYDINCRNRVFELKFRGDGVIRYEVRRDLWFRSRRAPNHARRLNVWYLFVDGPFGEHPRKEDFQRLGRSIPYLHWKWGQFLKLSSGPPCDTRMRRQDRSKLRAN